MHKTSFYIDFVSFSKFFYRCTMVCEKATRRKYDDQSLQNYMGKQNSNKNLRTNVCCLKNSFDQPSFFTPKKALNRQIFDYFTLYQMFPVTLSRKCANLEVLWSVFSRMRTKYGYLQSKSPLFSLNTEKHGTEKTPSSDIFHAMQISKTSSHLQI